MDEAQEPSWLSSLVHEADKLILAIGGYEEELSEHIFSDDESDSSESADESEIEIGSNYVKPGTRHAGDVNVETEGIGNAASTGAGLASDATGDDPSPIASTPKSVDADRLRSMSNDANMPLVTPARSRDPNGLDDEIGDGERSKSQMRNSVGTTGGAVGSLDPAWNTPAHDRERDGFKRGPPEIGGPSVVSRRMNRDRHRGGGTGDRNETDEPAARDTETESISEKRWQTDRHHTNKASKSGVDDTIGGIDTRTKKKSYSHVTDTSSWIQRKESPSITYTQPKLERSRAREGEASSSSLRLAAVSEEIRSKQGEAGFDGRAELVLPSRVRQNGNQSPLEVQEQRGRNLGTAIHPEAEAELDKHDVSSQYVGVSTKDNIGGAGKPPWAATASYPVESSTSALRADGRTLGEFSAKGEGTRDEQNRLEDSEAEQSEVEDSEASQSESEERSVTSDTETREDLRTATVGAKRMSHENGGVPQDASFGDWSLHPPEGFAPPKRGRTEAEYPLAVMRHSARLDDAIHERQRQLEAMGVAGDNGFDISNGGEKDARGLTNGGGDELAAIPWPDRARRPYDSPIIDSDLPARQAKELGKEGFGRQTLIVCSPFRRCLQTAGVVARTLGVPSVTVSLQMGERMDKVRKEIAESAVARDEVDSSNRGRGTKQQQPMVFSYLGAPEMLEALGAGVSLEGIIGEQPPEDETGVEAKERFIAAIAKVREQELRHSPVLMVAHGDTLDAAGESLASQIVFEANYCAWAVFDLHENCGYVKQSYGTQMIPL